MRVHIPSIAICYSEHMSQRLTAPRALTTLFARRIVRIATLLALAVAVAVFLLTWVLAYFFSSWWWLLIIPLCILVVLFLIVRIVVMIIIRMIHPNSLTKEQTVAMSGFIDKIQAILEARSTPLPFVVAVCIKDIVIHRDVVTIKKLITNTTGLRRDYAEIEKLFN